MLGDRGKILTKTPILVLVIVLISMGVGTASALITITLAGDVHVLGEMKIDETLLMGTDNPNDDDGIRFDDGSEVLFWDESETQFEFTDALVTSEVIQAGNAGADVAYNRIGSAAADSGWVSGNDDLLVQGSIEVNSKLIVDDEIFVGTDNGLDDDRIRFDDGTELLIWDESDTQFEFSDAVVTTGVIQAASGLADVAYSRIGAGVTDHGLANNIDLYVTGNLELDGQLLADNGIQVGTDNGLDDDQIRFDDGTEALSWDDSETQFEFTDAVVTTGVIQAGNVGADVAYNRIGAGIQDSLAINTSDDLFVSRNIEIDGDLFADSNIYVGVDNPDDVDKILFDDGSEFLQWDDSETQFEFTDALVTSGVIQAGNAGADVGYNRIGTGTAGTLEGADDLFVTDEIELDGDLFVDGDIWVGADSSTDFDLIRFDDGTKGLRWDNDQSRFEFNEQLAVDELFIGTDNVDHDIEFFTGGSPSGERFQWDESANAFEVSDDFTVFGKLTVTGLIDPPAITFSAETHDSIKQLAQNVEDHEEVMQFWNGDNNRFEVYVISQDVFYTFDGQEVKYHSTGIPENSAVNRLAEFEEQEKARIANPEVEESDPEIEE